MPDGHLVRDRRQRDLDRGRATGREAVEIDRRDGELRQDRGGRPGAVAVRGCAPGDALDTTSGPRSQTDANRVAVVADDVTESRTRPLPTILIGSVRGWLVKVADWLGSTPSA